VLQTCWLWRPNLVDVLFLTYLLSSKLSHTNIHSARQRWSSCRDNTNTLEITKTFLSLMYETTELKWITGYST